MVSDFAKQIQGLWLSVFFGIFLSVVYDILRIMRELTLPRKNAVFIMDFLFLAFSSVVTFIAAFATNYGVLRFYHIIGEIIGALVYFLTLGKATKLAARLIRKLLVKFESIYEKIICKMMRFLKNRKKCGILSKKGKKALKKLEKKI